jgi:hypothetical protein
MAAPTTKIDFTVGDQERLVKIEALQEKMLNKLSHLPCSSDNDLPCPQEGWITAVEKKVDVANSWVRGIVASLLVGSILTGAAAFLTHLARGG